MSAGAELIAQCTPIIAEAAAFIKSQLGAISTDQIEVKEANSLVSYVDKKAEIMLVEGLSKILPEAGFITEEDVTDDNPSELTWVIDPLDGTTNFLHGIPFFCVSVALRRGRETLLGIVHEAVRGEVFTAVQGEGSYLGDQKLRIKTVDLADALIATGFPYGSESYSTPYVAVLQEVMKHARGVRRLGSAALDLAYVAAGRFDGYYEYHLNAYDIAAGALLVTEAGGEVRGFYDLDDWFDGRSLIAGDAATVTALHGIIGQCVPVL